VNENLRPVSWAVRGRFIPGSVSIVVVMMRVEEVGTAAVDHLVEKVGSLRELGMFVSGSFFFCFANF